jgi:hypothetical protein
MGQRAFTSTPARFSSEVEQDTCDVRCTAWRKDLGALAQGSTFLVGHRRFEDAADTFPPDTLGNDRVTP